MAHEADLDFVGAGWLRVFPGPALWAYSYIGTNAWGKNGPCPGDLDEIDLGADRYGGLDVALDHAAITDGDEGEDEDHWTQKWAIWQRSADERGCRLETYRDVINFMLVIGLVERNIEDDVVWWRPAVPAPLAEDVLALNKDEQQVHAQLRWRSAFAQAEHQIITWLVDQRAEHADHLRLEISLSDLASELELDLDDARHGLVCAIDAPDISAVPDPERADADETVAISVDWQRFDQERFSVRLTPPDE